MAAPVTALDRDVRALAGMVSDYRADVPAQGLPTSLRSELEDKIGCDSVLFEGFRQRNWFAQSLPADDYAGDEGLVRAH